MIQVGPPQSILNPAAAPAHSLAAVTWFALIVLSVVSLIMWALIALITTRPRGTFEEHAPLDEDGGQSWILAGGFGVPFVILAVIFITGLVVMTRVEGHDVSAHSGAPHPADIRVVAHQWWWEARYLSGSLDTHFATANEIHIPVGRSVDVELISDDVIHSFWVPELNGKVDVVPGMVNHIHLEAERPGLYRGQCSEYCGAQHAGMAILVVADPPAEYDSWLERQRMDPPAPESDVAIRGRDLFNARPCGLCHTIRGSPAQGTLGPDLTHLASRIGLASNILPRNDANLAAWVVHAQALKPASRMPDINQFTGEELKSLITYLDGLR